MCTFDRLCERFMARNPGYEAYFDSLMSEQGNYRVYIGRIGDVGSWYIFGTCAEFRDWVNNVIMEG